jgi:DNA-binding transcriptional ArsR family regulator
MIPAAPQASKVIRLNSSCVQRNEGARVDEALSFHDLEVFLAFAEVEHLGRAAEALDLSVPAVQRTVRALEARLGVPLVRRDGRRVRLLHAGRILADQAARVIRARGDAVDAVLVAAGRERHVLRIGYMYSLVTSRSASNCATDRPTNSSTRCSREPSTPSAWRRCRCSPTFRRFRCSPRISG